MMVSTDDTGTPWLVMVERAVVDELDGLVVAVEPGWAMAPARDDVVGGHEGAGRLDLPPEVGGVEGSLQHRLVHRRSSARVKVSPRKACAMRLYSSLVRSRQSA